MLLLSHPRTTRSTGSGTLHDGMAEPLHNEDVGVGERERGETATSE
ncbi:MAG: hypothetical protein ACXWQR_09910 [Ktedonobacterales bacterium]